MGRILEGEEVLRMCAWGEYYRDTVWAELGQISAIETAWARKIRTWHIAWIGAMPAGGEE